MKNNIMIIVIVTLIAICVIAAVIVASIVNSSGNDISDIPIDSSGSIVSSSDHSSEIIDSESGGYLDESDAGLEESSVDVTVSSIDSESAGEDVDNSQSDGSSESVIDNSEQTLPETDDSTEYDNADDIVLMARSLIDTPFTENGENPSDGFDNSGFIYYVLRENGYITCPRIASEQARMGATLEYRQLKPGDLVFFRAENSDEVGYGGIFIGNDTMIACMMPGTYVKEVNISTNYYQTHFYCGVSLS